MNSLVLNSKNTKYLLLVMGVLFLACYPDLGFAQDTLLPEDGFDVPGTADDDSWLKKIAFLARIIVALVCLIGLGFGIAKSIPALFSMVTGGRDDGWGNALELIGQILLKVLFALGLFLLVNSFVISPLEAMFT